MAISVNKLFHLSPVKLQKNSPGRSSISQARAGAIAALRWSINRSRPSSMPPVVDCAPSGVDRIVLCIGYRPRWRSDTWRTDRGVAEVRSPGIRPATEDDIRHNAPGLLETVHRLLRIKVRRKLLNQDKTSRLASYALQQHEPKSAALDFSFLLAVLRLL